MGPPKSKPKSLSFQEFKRRIDCFEYRWNSQSQSYYLFNPWTGETIFNTNFDLVNRTCSMWAAPDKFPSENAQTVSLYPEFYASRSWGRRKYVAWESRTAAATHISAVCRGFLARQLLRKRFRMRYHTCVDNFSGYLYFVDKENLQADTVWYKPRLAFPGDILPLQEDDPEDFLNGKKYSRQDFRKGPFMKVKGLNKRDKFKPKLEAFFVENPWRDSALGDYSEIDPENTSVNSVIAWMEGTKGSQLFNSEFHLMRTLSCDLSWRRIVDKMQECAGQLIIELFGLRNFAKSQVPIDSSGLLSYAANEAMYLCVSFIKDVEKKHPPLLKIFAMEAFYNIMSVRPGRLEYLNTNLVPEQGELRQAAVEKFIADRVTIFNRYLMVIPSEVINVYAKGAELPEPVQRPLPRSIEVIETSLQCLSVLAHEIETKEQMAFLVVQPILFALDICQEAAYVTLKGLQLLYNLCYRCESGQEAILAYCNTKDFFGKVHHNHSGDPDVMRQCRRLELALKQHGWRGHVEELITKELKHEEIAEDYLLPSEFERK